MTLTNETALVQSRTFWSAVLTLVAVIAAQFQWTHVVGFATDPATVTNILNGVTMVGTVLSMVFRAKATAQVTSVLPK